MSQTLLFDNRKLLLCERSICFEVLNGDEIVVNENQTQLSSCGKQMITKEDFEDEARKCFGIKKEKVVWVNQNEITRIKALCKSCKRIKNFEKYEAEHFGLTTTCERCLIKEFGDYFFEGFGKEQQEEMLKEMEKQENE